MYNKLNYKNETAVIARQMLALQMINTEAMLIVMETQVDDIRECAVCIQEDSFKLLQYLCTGSIDTVTVYAKERVSTVLGEIERRVIFIEDRYKPEDTEYVRCETIIGHMQQLW